MITTVTIRGVEYDVEYHDHGYEPDTNAHDIDWEFVDSNAPDDLTDEEIESIYVHLAQLEPPTFDDDVM